MNKADKQPVDTQDAQQWLKKTSLVQNWERMKQDVEKHKWYESEKAGHDIGWDRAMVDWMIKIRKKHPDGD